MLRAFLSLLTLCIGTSSVSAQSAPTYSKDIRPFIAKYCLECHNAKTQKGTLSLETHKSMMEGTDLGKVIKPGQPNASKLVLVTEGKEKPTMPPAKAKFRPTKDEIAMLRAWVAAGARDDGANIKIELPAIKPKADVLAPVTALTYLPISKTLLIARNQHVQHIAIITSKAEGTAAVTTTAFPANVTAISVYGSQEIALAGVSRSGESGDLVTFRPGVETGEIVKLGHTDTILDLVNHRNANTVAFASQDSQIRLYEAKSGKPVHVLKEHSDAVYGLAFNPDGKLLASVSADRAMKVTDVETGKLLYTLGEATDWLYTVAWSPDGKHLVSGGVDKSIRVYSADKSGAKLRQSVFAHEGAVLKVLFSSDSKTLYSVGEDRVIKAWDIDKMVERKVYDKQPETVLCMALREDAKQIIVGRYDGIVQLIDVQTGKVAHEFGKPAPKKTSALPASGGRKSPDATSLVMVSHEQAESGGLRPPLADVRPGQSPATGAPTTLPAKLAGTLDRAGAVHFYRFDVKAGQQLGVQIIKEGTSKLEPVLTLTSMAGQVFAESNEGHLGHTFVSAGSYAIGVRDREYKGGADFKYRLNLGDIPVVTAVFPMGMQRGTKGDIQLEGVFLPKKMIPIVVPKDAKVGDIIPIPVGAGVLGKAQFVVGELPEVTDGGKMLVHNTANGRITKNDHADLWTFAARKGQRLVVEVNARRLGSRLDSVIEILDSKLQPVPRAVLRSQAKTHVTFRDHDSAQGNIRIETWSDLGPNDYLYVGNELMKIQALPSHPDADCNFFATAGQRVTYLDTTATHHANNTPMYKVSQHPPGTTFPPNGFPVFTLYYRNDDGGPGFGRDSRILFDPPTDGEYQVRIADARGMGGVNFGYRLTVRHPKEHFVLRYAPTQPIVSKGSAIPITVTAERIDGFNGPITVRAMSLPPGLHMPTTTIEAGTYTTTVALYADANAKLPEKAKLAMEGQTFATGMPFANLGVMEMPKLIEPGDIVTTTLESEVAIKPGQQAKLTVRIRRKPGFTGRVPLDVKGLPHGVRVLDIGLNGILVNENETTRTVVLYAEPWVAAQDHPFVVLARREGKNTEHAAKSVLLKVK